MERSWPVGKTVTARKGRVLAACHEDDRRVPGARHPFRKNGARRSERRSQKRASQTGGGISQAGGGAGRTAKACRSIATGWTIDKACRRRGPIRATLDQTVIKVRTWAPAFD